MSNHPQPTKPLLGAVLIGGQSTRMGGGIDKASVRLPDGRTMTEHVAAALRSVCEDHTIVLVGASAGQPRGEHASKADAGEVGDYVHVFDLRPQVGPLGAIEALLASDLADEYLICPCDVPYITGDVLRVLLGNRQSSATVLRVRHRERFEPMPARIASAALPVVQQLLDRGERSIWRLMEELPAAIVDVDMHHAAALRNINTPDDLRQLNTP